MKKLLALLVVGSLLALTTGCPPAPSSEPVKPPRPTTPASTTPAPTTPAPTGGATEKTAKGTVTKVEKDSLSYKGDDGKEMTVKIPADAKVTLDGKEDKLENVKADSTVTVTTKGDAVTKVEAKAAAAPPVLPPPAGEAKTTTGKVTKIDKDSLSYKGDDGKEVTVKVPADAKVTIDGKEDKLENVKAGSDVSVTAKGDAVSKVEAKAAAAPPPPPPPPPPPAGDKPASGKVTKIDKDSLTYKGDDGKEVTVKVPADAKVTIDGKDDKLENVKADMKVTVTSKGDAVTKIDATK